VSIRQLRVERFIVKKSILILLFAGLNLVLIQNCGDSDDTGSQRQYLDNDVNDPDRSLDNDGDSFKDMDANDATGQLDDDAGDTSKPINDNDPNDPDRSMDNDGDMFDNDTTTDND
jgi:hypothetical protein